MTNPAYKLKLMNLGQYSSQAFVSPDHKKEPSVIRGARSVSLPDLRGEAVKQFHVQEKSKLHKMQYDGKRM